MLGLPGFGSTSFPVPWQLCLAVRAHCIGSTFTTAMRMRQEETDALLGIPADSDWEFHAMVPLGRPLGNWGLAKRPPAHLFTYSESFGTPVNWTITEPAWQTAASQQDNG